MHASQLVPGDAWLIIAGSGSLQPVGFAVLLPRTFIHLVLRVPEWVLVKCSLSTNLEFYFRTIKCVPLSESKGSLNAQSRKPLMFCCTHNIRLLFPIRYSAFCLKLGCLKKKNPTAVTNLPVYSNFLEMMKQVSSKKISSWLPADCSSSVHKYWTFSQIVSCDIKL